MAEVNANDTRETLIHLDSVRKVFYTEDVETHALADIHIDIKNGEYVAIAGPSGCGKTTLLSILGLLDTPSEGDYQLDGEPVSNLTASQRARIRNRHIGFIFQAFNLIGDLNVYENVELPLTYRGMATSERKERVHEALEKVGMSHRVKHYPSQLSGGQQQRVAAAPGAMTIPRSGGPRKTTTASVHTSHGWESRRGFTPATRWSTRKPKGRCATPRTAR